MKIKAMSALLLSSVLATGAFAANYNGPVANTGGYTGPGAQLPVSTVAQAKDARDETYVVLEGRITKRLKDDDHYEFTDGSGTITVDIDDDEWPAQSIDENTKVRLYGEIDKDFLNVDIDVEHLEIIQ